ncbi:HD domain-containing protein [Oricola cellulosilytica]|nr:HD domain-containing protein [Oricola cellulosilytica]
MAQSDGDLEKRLAFVREAGRMKDIHRSGFTIEGQPESVAEHSWRLCLLVMCFSDLLDGIDVARLLKLCIVHDLGEIYAGDVPAIHQSPDDGRKAREQADVAKLASFLPEDLEKEVAALWAEYEEGVTREAILAKGFDKLETMMTHNQGKNPPDFDYRFNLEYGRERTDAHTLIRTIRSFIDADTEQLAAERQG